MVAKEGFKLSLSCVVKLGSIQLNHKAAQKRRAGQTTLHSEKT